MSIPAGHPQTIAAALAYWAAATPDAIAVLAPGREPATYRELHEAVHRLAASPRACGLGRQDGVALLLPEGPDLCLALLAAMAAGIAIPLPWPAPETDSHRLLSSPRVRAVVVSGESGPKALALAGPGVAVISLSAGASGRIGDFRVEGRSAGDPPPAERPDAEDVALILHSSGTTGRPKVVPRTHRNLFSTANGAIAARGVTSADRCMTSGRLVHSQGITTLTATIRAGATLISMPSLDTGSLPSLLRDFRPTCLSTTPAVLRALAADRGSSRDALQHAPLRCIHSSAGPLATDEIAALESRLGVRIRNGYGMSEATGIAGERYVGFQRAPGAVGSPWCDVRIVDPDGSPVGTGDTGEITVRGERVFPGYLDDPEANAAAFLPGGWFRTGDVGFLDETGFLHLTGRLSEIINRGGEKIAPAEVDRVLLRHPAVADAAVFAVPDARLGEDVVAAVVLKPGAATTPRELRGWMLDRLSAYKAPRRIWLVEDLPRTPTGKVQRGALARFWSENHG